LEEFLSYLRFSGLRLCCLLLLLTAASAQVSYDPAAAAAIAAVSQDALVSDLQALTGVVPVTVGGAAYWITSRYTYSGTPITKATQYVYERCAAAGLNPSYQVWGGSRNTICEKPGTTRASDLVLLTAHLDDANGVPGADDNASGSAAVLQAMDVLAQGSFPRTIRFVWFTGEEQGLLGSRPYADLMASQHQHITAVINLDLEAWNEDGVPRAKAFTGKKSLPATPANRAIADVYAGVIAVYGINLVPVADANFPESYYSDNEAFWEKGLPAVLIGEDYPNDYTPYMHSNLDSLASLTACAGCLPYYADQVKALAGTIVHLATQPAVPTATFSASPPSIQMGHSSTLSWSTANAASIEISGIGAVALSGSYVVQPALTTAYTLTAMGPDGTATASVTVTVTAAAPPAAPISLSASYQSGPQIKLTWRDQSSNETGFVLERCAGAGCNSFAPLAAVGPHASTGSMTYYDTQVAVGNTYSYRVQAIAGDASSAYSNTATASVPAPPSVPAAPTNLACAMKAGSTSQAVCSWKDNANNETGFTAQDSKNNFAAVLSTGTVNANVTSITDTGLARRTQYWFRVRASNAAGTSAWSNVVSLTTP
jgi:hypothetical protein